MTEKKRLTDEKLEEAYKDMAEDENYTREQAELCEEFKWCLSEALERLGEY